MNVGVPKETWPGETRVAIVPAAVPPLLKSGISTVIVEQGAGVAAGYPDELYRAQGATIAPRADVFRDSDIVLQVRSTPVDPALRTNQVVIGFADPLGSPGTMREFAKAGATAFSMELMP